MIIFIIIRIVYKASVLLFFIDSLFIISSFFIRIEFDFFLSKFIYKKMSGIQGDYHWKLFADCESSIVTDITLNHNRLYYLDLNQIDY